MPLVVGKGDVLSGRGHDIERGSEGAFAYYGMGRRQGQGQGEQRCNNQALLAYLGK